MKAYPFLPFSTLTLLLVIWGFNEDRLSGLLDRVKQLGDTSHIGFVSSRKDRIFRLLNISLQQYWLY